jgi:arginine/serine-rich splicing factor 7
MSRIFVRNIPAKVTQGELENIFKSIGKVNDIILKTNFAFIQYEQEKDAYEALKSLNDYSLSGNKLIVELAKSRYEKLAERMNEKCFKCGEFGHWAKDCKTLKRQRREEKRKFKRMRKSPKRSFSRSLSKGDSRSSRSRSRSRSR